MGKRLCHNPVSGKTEECQMIIRQLHRLLENALYNPPPTPSAPDAPDTMIDPRDPSSVLTLEDGQRLLDDLWHTIQSPLVNPRTQTSMTLQEGQEFIDLLCEENDFFKRQNAAEIVDPRDGRRISYVEVQRVLHELHDTYLRLMEHVRQTAKDIDVSLQNLFF